MCADFIAKTEFLKGSAWRSWTYGVCLFEHHFVSCTLFFACNSSSTHRNLENDIPLESCWKGIIFLCWAFFKIRVRAYLNTLELVSNDIGNTFKPFLGITCISFKSLWIEATFSNSSLFMSSFKKCQKWCWFLFCFWTCKWIIDRTYCWDGRNEEYGAWYSIIWLQRHGCLENWN